MQAILTQPVPPLPGLGRIVGRRDGRTAAHHRQVHRQGCRRSLPGHARTSIVDLRAARRRLESAPTPAPAATRPRSRRSRRATRSRTAGLARRRRCWSWPSRPPAFVWWRHADAPPAVGAVGQAGRRGALLRQQHRRRVARLDARRPDRHDRHRPVAVGGHRGPRHRSARADSPAAQARGRSRDLGGRGPGDRAACRRGSRSWSAVTSGPAARFASARGSRTPAPDASSAPNGLRARARRACSRSSTN